MEHIEGGELSETSDHDFLRSHLKKTIVCAIFIGLSIIFYLNKETILLNLPIQPVVYLQDTFNISSDLSHHQFEVVLSYYKENVNDVARFIQYLRNVPTLKKLRPYIIIYNKNSMINNTYLKEVLKADVVHQLPNLGREGATYLYHIIETYDRLANHILFCQAGVEGISKTGLEGWLLHRLNKQFNSTVGYMPLVNIHWMAIFNCGRWGSENVERLPQLWGIIQQELCPPTGQVVAFRGQFLVSAKRIRDRPLRIYKYLNDLITVNKTHWIHYTHDSTPDNPVFGHVIERVWTTLFNCTEPDLIGRCHRQNQCACFD